MRCALFAAGEEPDLALCRAAAASARLVVCADGGYALAQAAGVTVDLVVGDLDSLPSRPVGPALEVHPREKDESDLELALLAARERGATEVVLLGALGGRLDHTLFNLVAGLSYARELGLAARVLGSAAEIWLVDRELRLEGRTGRLFSLLALSERATGVDLSGFAYELRAGTLQRARSRGLSNIITADPALVRVNEGLLLAILPGGPSVT